MVYFSRFTDQYPFLGSSILSNTVLDWLLALSVFLLLLVVLKIVKTIIISRIKTLLKKTKTQIDDMLIDAVEAIHWPFFVFASLYVALQFLSVKEVFSRAAYYIFMIAITYYAVRFLSRLVNYGTENVIQKRAEAEQSQGVVRLAGTVVKLGLWVSALLLILSNMGYNVTSLIAGLGIGGLAIGLAVQNILSDLFSSLAIYLDKPFKTGDFVIIDNYMGTVKHVGVKTTRIEALQGEEIVMSNSDLINSRIQNFGVMQKRRVVFTVGITYDTPAEKLEKIPSVIREIIDKEKSAEIDRAHLQSFGDSSLVYEIVYYVESGDYNVYMDTQQSINMDIIRRFEEMGVSIAFPTRTVHIENK